MHTLVSAEEAVDRIEAHRVVEHTVDEPVVPLNIHCAELHFE